MLTVLMLKHLSDSAKTRLNRFYP